MPRFSTHGSGWVLMMRCRRKTTFQRDNDSPPWTQAQYVVKCITLAVILSYCGQRSSESLRLFRRFILSVQNWSWWNVLIVNCDDLLHMSRTHGATFFVRSVGCSCGSGEFHGTQEMRKSSHHLYFLTSYEQGKIKHVAVAVLVTACGFR